MPKLIPHSLRKIQKTIEKEGTIRAASAVLGCHENSLSLLILRKCPEWMEAFRAKKRKVTRARASRRWLQRKRARALIQECELDPSAWESLPQRDRILISDYRQGLIG